MNIENILNEIKLVSNLDQLEESNNRNKQLFNLFSELKK